MKYLNYDIVFEEIPNEVTLALNVTNCQNHCVGCHSPELRDDIGTVLTHDEIDRLIESNYGITCICFMGEGKDVNEMKDIVEHIREKYGHTYKIGVYSGRNDVEDWYWELFNYVKIGPYIEEFGPLNKETTNQRLYYGSPVMSYASTLPNGKVIYGFMDITNKFWMEGRSCA